jgi:Tol biopolymer transport system component
LPLAPTTRLGPYEIICAIGAGGMGEVYRAKDTRLDRIVAIKVLPPDIAQSTEARQRFEREARAVSSLNHPHICALFDIGNQGGIDFLVMEFLEGETLASRLEKGPLAIDQVLRYGVQIADALDRAHRQGVVHRDLKPGNIMLTKDGAKLLDFGLAKLGPASRSAPDETLTRALTSQGTILGTFQYMAPEQLEGKDADARSDIFAFGAVLYEMATSRRAFQGKSQASLIAAIFGSEPTPVSTLQPMTPRALDHVVATCLAKDPEARWQTAHDLLLELRWIAAGEPQTEAAPVRTRRSVWLAAALGLLLLATAAVSVRHWLEKPPELHAIRSSIMPPENATFRFTGVNAGPVTVSPDGRRLAFVATSDGKDLLWVRRLDALTAQPLAGTEGAVQPFWSADSRFIGFFADRKLKRIEASGGPALKICDAAMGRNGTWNRDGVIVFAPDIMGALYRVPAAGGVAIAATKPSDKPDEATHRWPWFLPDGRHFLYLSTNAPGLRQADMATIYVASLDSNERKPVLRVASNVAYADGHLLFVRERTLMAQPFDTRHLEITGDAFPVAEQIQFDPSGSQGGFSVSQNGVLAYETTGEADGSQLTWLDRSGKQTGVVGEYGIFGGVQLSPDGKRVLASANIAGNTDIWIFGLARGLGTRFTFDPAADRFAVWSPDSSRVIFSSVRKGHFDLYQKPADGTGIEEVILESKVDKNAESWSPDGRFLLYTIYDPSTRQDLWVLPLDGQRKPFPFLQTPSNENYSQFSPDGRWVAYSSDESGRMEIYVAPFTGGPSTLGGKRQVSKDGGFHARWRHDGTEIFYQYNGRMMAAEVNGKGSSFEVGAVHPLFERRLITTSGYAYDVSADGQHFLVNALAGQKASNPVTLVINWGADLKR